MKLPEDDADMLKRVGVLIYKILLVYICIYICICCAFVGLDNKLYMMHGKYIKIQKKFLLHISVLWPIPGSIELCTLTATVFMIKRNSGTACLMVTG
jgi:hypothetical protein